MTRSTGLRQLALIAALTAVALMGLTATPTADAHPRGSVRIWVGAPWSPWWWGPGPWGYYGPGPYVVERPVVVQAPVDNTVTVPAAPQAYSWYYCRDSQMYYPHVTSCASPWQEVPASPAPESAPAATSAASPAVAPVTSAPAPAPARVGQPVPAAR